MSLRSGQQTADSWSRLPGVLRYFGVLHMWNYRWSPELLRSFATIQANVIGADDPAALIHESRAITMSTTVRRRPNCFNLLFQMRLLEKMGNETFEKAWTKKAITMHLNLWKLEVVQSYVQSCARRGQRLLNLRAHTRLGGVSREQLLHSWTMWTMI